MSEIRTYTSDYSTEWQWVKRDIDNLLEEHSEAKIQRLEINGYGNNLTYVLVLAFS